MSEPASKLNAVSSHFGALRSKADAWAELPAPPETFVMREVPECAVNEFCTLREGKAIQHVEKTRHQSGGGDVWTYRWHPEAWKVVQEALEGRYTPCPCGHGGLRNCGDHFECCYGGCDKQYSRDELEVGGE